jgi:hypothetical protein
MKRAVLLAASAALAGCVSSGGNYATMKTFIGMTIGQVIVGNGQPESRVRLDNRRVAYTFHMRNQGVYGNASGIYTVTNDCRFTFIVDQPGGHSDRSRVIDVMDPGPRCR